MNPSNVKVLEKLKTIVSLLKTYGLHPRLWLLVLPITENVPNSRLECNNDTKFMTKMAKIDTLFYLTKTPKKTYPLGPYIPIYNDLFHSSSYYDVDNKGGTGPGNKEMEVLIEAHHLIS